MKKDFLVRLDNSVKSLKRVKTKMEELPLQEVIDSEWKLKNFSIRGMILSIMNAEPPREKKSADDLKYSMERELLKWKEKNKN